MFGHEILAFFQVILIDIVLSGDNAVIIGALAAGLVPELRNKALIYGMIAAVVLRIALSLGVVWLLQIPCVMIIGGALLFYVAYKMWRDLRDDGSLNDSEETKQPKTMMSALIAIALADLSMSLDNVLGVAGAASGHVPALVVGLILSVLIMGCAAKVVSSLIDRHKWIAWVGLVLIIFVACRMVYHGLPEALALFA